MTERLEPGHQPVSYPPAPWQMAGSMWLSLLWLRHGVDADRPAGLYGAAFLSYDDPSPLTYSELLVARPVRTVEHGRRVTITDIWVDSAASVAGGRELWAIPKGICDFSKTSPGAGRLSRTEWAAGQQGRPLARARFTDASHLAPRIPFGGGVWQPGIDDTDGEERAVALRGSGRALPCRAHWHFAPDGPLGWLGAARPLASFRMADFRLDFG